ncbi:hypothetical protein [Pedobacter steynii]
MNPIDIVKSWNKSFNPSDDDLALAKERADICNACPSKVKDDSLLNVLVKKDSLLEGFKCNECGCPLAKKIYSQFGCPLNKW